MSRQSAGFTLIELMIALVVSSIMVVPLYMLTRSLNRQAGAQADGVEAMERARTAMTIVGEDLRRAGLHASPNPENDPASFTRNLPTAAGYSRRAVVHENRDNDGNDSILLVGNFLGSDTYRAQALGNQLVFQEEMDDRDDCVRQFSPAYAFAHVLGPNNASVDMKIASVDPSGNGCVVTVDSGETSDQAYSDGDEVWVAANQALRYRVRQTLVNDAGCNTATYDLVRVFVDYTASGGACSTDEVADTLQVVASHVSDFQVWLRPVTPVLDSSDNRTRLELHGHDPGDLQTGGYPFTPVASSHYITQNADPETAVTESNFGCSGAYVLGPEHVRSAVVRLSVQTESPALDLDYRPFLDDPTDTDDWQEETVAARRSFFTMVPYADGGVASQCPNRPGAAHLAKTVVTEVLMPNLAARSDILATN